MLIANLPAALLFCFGVAMLLGYFWINGNSFLFWVILVPLIFLREWLVEKNLDCNEGETVNYRQGQMNWPLKQGWKCEICGENIGLEWSFIHAHCRCNKCCAPYVMRDFDKEGGPVVDVPILSVKDEFLEPLKVGWKKLHTDYNNWTDAQWIKFGVPKEVFIKLVAEEHDEDDE